MAKTSVVAGRAVICDDDALIRSVIRQVLGDSSLSVVGEADTPEDALETIETENADVLILDLALRGGNGEAVLNRVHTSRPDVRIVVYSAYAADPAQLLAAGATAVIDKPDFGRLQTVLGEIVSEMGLPLERRQDPPRETVDRPGPTAVSLSGFEPWESYLAVVPTLVAGDAILCADILPGPTAHDIWDDVFATDHRLALGRAMAAERRTGDRISVSPNGRPVLLLVGGRPEAPASVFRRLGLRWQREVDAGSPVGAFGLIRSSDDPLERLMTVESSVVLDRGTPLRMV